MIIDVITLFPEVFNDFKSTSILKRALEQKLVTINIHNLRDYTPYNHGQVDDAPYGGGSGMVLMIEPVYKALEELKKRDTKVILTTPQAKPYLQKDATKLSNEKHLIIICGHYEGFDERIRTLVDMEISIGDYILTGGEIPAMVIIDSVTRLIPGVIKEESHQLESYSDNLLDYPVYTKPREFNGMSVPEVLLSGNHKEIDKYRKEQQVLKTKTIRPDLWRQDNEL